MGASGSTRLPVVIVDVVALTFVAFVIGYFSFVVVVVVVVVLLWLWQAGLLRAQI